MKAIQILRPALLMLAFLAATGAIVGADGAEIAPPDITKEAGVYTVVFHVTDPMEGAKKAEGAFQDAAKYFGASPNGSVNQSMPRDDGRGWDVSYRFLK